MTDWSKAPIGVSVALTGGILVLLAGLLVTGFNISLTDRYAIEAGAIQGPLSALRGTFIIRKRGWFTKGYSLGLHTHGTGGACLVALPDEIGLGGLVANQCSNSSGCNPPQFDPKSPKYNPNYEGYSGYCNASETSGGQCWVRPGDGAHFCNRSKDYLTPVPWPAGVKEFANRAPLNASVFHSVRLGKEQAQYVHWRVVACLNGIDPTKPGVDVTDCGHDGPNRLEVMGPVSQIPVP